MKICVDKVVERGVLGVRVKEVDFLEQAQLPVDFVDSSPTCYLVKDHEVSSVPYLYISARVGENWTADCAVGDFIPAHFWGEIKEGIELCRERYRSIRDEFLREAEEKSWFGEEVVSLDFEDNRS